MKKTYLYTLALAAAIATAGIMSGCSDNESISGPSALVIETESVTVGNDPTAQNYRITFYGNNVSALSRAAQDFPEMGSCPNIPEGTPEFNTPNAADQSQDENKKNGYVLTGGSGQISLYGSNVYIKGDVSTHNINGTGTVYVMDGANLTITANVQSGVTIKAYGTLETGSNGITVGKEASVFTKGNLIVNGRFAVEGTCVVAEELTIHNMLQVSGGRIKAKCIEVDGSGNEGVNMSGGGELAVRSYLNTPYLYMGSDANVYLYPNAMADVTEKTSLTSNTSSLTYYSSEGKTDGHALLNTNELHVEGGADSPEYINAMFANNLKVDYETLTNTQPAHIADFKSPAEDYYIVKDGCNKGHGTDGKPSFDPVVDIETPTHTHDYLSATCVQGFNGKAYVCYHLNEAYSDNGEYAAASKHQGCVEAYDISESGAQITSWLLNENFDFNHLIINNNTMYAVGDKADGGFMGTVALGSDGGFGQQTTTMETVKLNGNSGNCIISDGNNFRLATNTGFQSLNVSDLVESSFVATSGSAKHIATGSGVIATLNLTQRGVSSSAAEVTIYNPWGTQSSRFNVSSDITPVNGKNVIAVDGNSVYVCLGQNGVEKYSLTGEREAGYNWITAHPDSKGKPCANGIAVDDNYIYVAYGAAGLLVFDKNLNRVARYYHQSDADGSEKYSANYVSIVNGLIYISYGRNGLEVLKMKN